MDVIQFDDPAAFQAHARVFLLARAAAHCLLWGLSSMLLIDRHYYGPDDPYMTVVERAGEVVAAALRTPPYGLTLSYMADAAPLEPIAADVYARYATLPTVLGSRGLGLKFAEIWRDRTGYPFAQTMAERIYQLARVNPVTGVPGAPRPATPADRALVSAWRADFQREALGEEPDLDRVAQAVDRQIAQGGYWLWQDEGAPVALVGFTGPTPNGMRIAPVYTPPDRRRRGYASALTAAVSQMLLDGGRRYCFLFTDLTNPTSNHIYQEIGYQPVVDVDMYRFEVGN